MRFDPFALAALSVLGALAQEQPEPVFKVDTAVRQIDAVVADKQGRAVTGLTASDFEIVEGRVARPVEYCSFIPLTGPHAASARGDGRLSAGQLRRTFVFVVSNPNVTVDLGPDGGAVERARLRAAIARGGIAAAGLLEHFVRNRMQPGDLVEVLKVDQDTGVLAQLTSDRTALLAAIAKMREDPMSLASGRVEVRFHRPPEGRNRPRPPLFPEVGMGRRPAPRRASMQPPSVKPPDFQDLMAQNLRAIRLISAATEQIASLPGRRTIILAAQFMLSNNPKIPEGQIVGRALADAARQANGAGVTVHSMSLAGLGVGDRTLVPGSTDALFTIASQTGGKYIQESNDLSESLDSILELNRGYYLLGYRPADGAQGPGPVKVRVRRAGCEVYARNAGIAPGVLAGGKPVSTDSAAAEAFASPLRLDDLPVAVEAGSVPPLPRRGKTTIRCELKIDLTSVPLVTQETGNQGFNLELTIGLAGPDGRYVRFDSNIHHFQIAKGSEQSFPTEMTRPYEFEVDKPGQYQVRVLVRDTHSNRAGTAARFVEVENGK